MTEYKIFKWSKRLTFSIYHTGEYHTHTHGFFARWLAGSEAISNYYLPSSRRKDNTVRQEFNFWPIFWYVVIIEPIFWFLCGTYLISVVESDQGDLATSQLGTCSPLSTYTSMNNCQLLVWQRDASNFSVCVLNCKFLGAKMSEHGGDVSNWKGIVVLRVSPFQSSP